MGKDYLTIKSSRQSEDVAGGPAGAGSGEQRSSRAPRCTPSPEATVAPAPCRGPPPLLSHPASTAPWRTPRGLGHPLLSSAWRCSPPPLSPPPAHPPGRYSPPASLWARNPARGHSAPAMCGCPLLYFENSWLPVPEVHRPSLLLRVY